MPETLIKVDLAQSPYENAQIHNRWHPDIPMAVWVKPGDDFVLETYDWTGGAIKNDDDASDVRDVDLSTVHFLSGPVGVEGAEPGDLLVVDRARPPSDGKIVVAALNGELTVKRLSTRHGQVRLMPANPAFAPIEIDEASELMIWGVVSNVIHKL